jgi:hypothetical protein
MWTGGVTFSAAQPDQQSEQNQANKGPDHDSSDCSGGPEAVASNTIRRVCDWSR